MRIRITELHPESIWNGTDNIINNVFELHNQVLFPTSDGWFFVTPKDERFGGSHILCKYIEVPEPSKKDAAMFAKCDEYLSREPSAMSELAGRINDYVETQNCKCVLIEKQSTKKVG